MDQRGATVGASVRVIRNLQLLQQGAHFRIGH